MVSADQSWAVSSKERSAVFIKMQRKKNTLIPLYLSLSLSATQQKTDW